jgi:RimJ/RimL family protein N-acetyltransferase
VSTPPIGAALPGWTPRQRPQRAILHGRTCRLEPLNADAHAAALYQAISEQRDDDSWAYLGYGPWASFEAYRAWVSQMQASEDPLFFCIVDAQGPAGVASYLRITPQDGAIEVGHIHYTGRMQRSVAATEAMYLMMRHVFELGYRRYEWKCNALNAPSRAAAARLGFSYEGTFRQHLIVKGRNRDTAWFSILDHEWSAQRVRFEAWLAPDNFDAHGRQRAPLARTGS